MIRATGNSSGDRLSELGFRNSMVVSLFISMRFTYLAGKNRENGPAAYSTLKPILVQTPPLCGQMGCGLFRQA